MLAKLNSNLPVILVGILMTTAVAAGCSKKKAAAKPGPASTATDTTTFTTTDTSTDTSIDETLEFVMISPDSALAVESGSAVSVEFELRGAGSKEFAIGFVDLPDGAQLEVSGDTARVTWSDPDDGDYDIVLAARDMASCRSTESSDTACNVDEITPMSTQSYDTVSETYALRVGEGGTRSSLIEKILAALTGGDSNGVLTGLLDDLSVGQLTDVLEQVGNGTFSFASLLDLLRGTALTDDSAKAKP